MPHYTAPLADFRFLLQEVHDYEREVAALPGLSDATMDTVQAILENAGRFVSDVILPLNLPGDAEGCRMDAQGVHTPEGYQHAWQAYRDGGWPGLAAEPTYGGQGLPTSLAIFVRELVAAGSMSFGMYGGLSQGAYKALLAHGSDDLKRRFLPAIVEGRWTGTMCMTEAESGSDLSRLRTRATPAADGSYRVTGSKIFISGGDHDLAENIVHMVLARLPDAPPGTRGISLFVVPKFLPPREGAPGVGAFNHVHCTGIEHKMGIRASATAALAFEESHGWLIGDPHGGLRAMFTMMNSSRVGVAVQSVGLAEVSYQNALAYARERLQGRSPVQDQRDASKPADPIIMHPDVRKTLLTMKALTEGCRALYVDSAMALDVRALHPDAQFREQADESLALMTPVLKAFISDCGVAVADLGISVFGGHGYIHESGAEQWLRDARIVPLYEGTNAIQALDLIHRKLTLSDGRPMQVFVDRTQQLIEQAGRIGELSELGNKLAAGLGHLRDATSLMRTRLIAQPVDAAAAASDYLRLFGLVAMGAAWLRMAARAQAALAEDASNESPPFYRGKIKTARFFMTHLLPETTRLWPRIQAGAEAIVDVASEEL